ncbi:outer membrane protein [Bradyrhizobium sp. 25ACV]
MQQAVYDWTGFYIGANGGYGWASSKLTAPGNPDTSSSPSGGLAGGQLGYNWQTGAVVLGVEGDADWANIRGSTSCPGAAFVCASNTRALATLRGRIGWAAGPVLLYGTAGGAYANEHYSALTPAGGAFAGTTGVNDADRWGYSAGAGVEYGFTPNWSAKVEYMHYGFGTTRAPQGTLAPGPVPVDLHLSIDTVKVGVNYRWGGPIIAKY